MDEREPHGAPAARTSPANATGVRLLKHVLAEGSLLNDGLERLTAAVRAAVRVPDARLLLAGDPGLAGVPATQAGAAKETVAAREAVAATEAEPGDSPKADADTAVAHAAQPIVMDGRVLGRLAISDHAGREWSEGDLTTLRAFADLAAFLIAAQMKLQGELSDQRASAQARDDRQTAELDHYAEQVSEQDQVEVLSRRLQSALLPQSTPPGDLVIDAFYEPGSQRLLLGGDFADAVRDPDDNLNFVIGDVTGHGPEAAALAISLRASWNALQGVGLPLARITAELDRQTNSSGLLATVLLGRIEHDGRLCLLGAGHPSPLLVKTPAAHELDIGRGPMLGLNLEAPRWPMTEHDLGDHELIAYTDGLIEGHVGTGAERFEIERLIETIARHGTDPAVLCAVATEANGEPLPDDVAILRIRPRR